MNMKLKIFNMFCISLLYQLGLISGTLPLEKMYAPCLANDNSLYSENVDFKAYFISIPILAIGGPPVFTVQLALKCRSGKSISPEFFSWDLSPIRERYTPGTAGYVDPTLVISLIVVMPTFVDDGVINSAVLSFDYSPNLANINNAVLIAAGATAVQLEAIGTNILFFVDTTKIRDDLFLELYVQKNLSTITQPTATSVVITIESPFILNGLGIPNISITLGLITVTIQFRTLNRNTDAFFTSEKMKKDFLNMFYSIFKDKTNEAIVGLKRTMKYVLSDIERSQMNPKKISTSNKKRRHDDDSDSSSDRDEIHSTHHKRYSRKTRYRKKNFGSVVKISSKIRNMFRDNLCRDCYEDACEYYEEFGNENASWEGKGSNLMEVKYPIYKSIKSLPRCDDIKCIKGRSQILIKCGICFKKGQKTICNPGELDICHKKGISFIGESSTNEKSSESSTDEYNDSSEEDEHSGVSCPRSSKARYLVRDMVNHLIKANAIFTMLYKMKEKEFREFCREYKNLPRVYEKAEDRRGLKISLRNLIKFYLEARILNDLEKINSKVKGMLNNYSSDCYGNFVYDIKLARLITKDSSLNELLEKYEVTPELYIKDAFNIEDEKNILFLMDICTGVSPSSLWAIGSDEITESDRKALGISSEVSSSDGSTTSSTTSSDAEVAKKDVKKKGPSSIKIVVIVSVCVAVACASGAGLYYFFL